MPTSEPETIVAFSYGSNMLTSWIRQEDRCPSAQPLGRAELHGYKLNWHKRSKDESGKCDVKETADGSGVVYGVLYEIPLSEESELDKAEGFRKGYDKKKVEVTFNGEARTVSLYYATESDDSRRPYTWYKWLVLAGADEHVLPPDYIALLEAVDADQDPIELRHDRNAKFSASYRGENRQ